MRNHLSSFLLVAVVALCCTTLALAQAPNVAITMQPQVQSTGPDSAIVTWSTNVPSNAVVYYGTDANNLSQKAEAPWGGTNHSVTLNKLKSGQTYYYKVGSGEASGTGTAVFSQVSQFVAGQGSSAQPSSNSSAVQITAAPQVRIDSSNSATITWSTSAPASSVVKYGTNPNDLSQTAKAPWGGTNHSVTLSGLHPGQTYYYYVTSGEASGTGTSASSQMGQFVAGQGH